MERIRLSLAAMLVMLQGTINAYAQTTQSPTSLTCYDDVGVQELTDEEIEQIDELNALVPLGGDCGQGPPPFPDIGILFGTSCVWYRPGDNGPNGGPLRYANLADLNRLQRSSLTYSFSTQGDPFQLQTVLACQFDLSTSHPQPRSRPDRGKEIIRQALATYVRNSGIDIAEVIDLPSVITTTSPQRTNGVGDIRIQARPITGQGQASFPPQGGDFTLDTNPTLYYEQRRFNRLRQVALHELGHAICFTHFDPFCGAFTMETPVPTLPDGVSAHERRALARNYDDRFFGNNTWDDAYEFGELDGYSVIERNLALNLTPVVGCDARGNTSPAAVPIPNPNVNFPLPGDCDWARNPADDWFRFTLLPGDAVKITVDPTGGDYWYAPYPSQHARFHRGAYAGSIALFLYLDDDGTPEPLEGVAQTALGLSVELLVPSRQLPTTYRLLVRETAVNAAEEPGVVVQPYHLRIDVTGERGRYVAPPRAVAGIAKIVGRNDYAWFIGDRLSEPNEPGTEIVKYEWDLDGDGDYEVSSSATSADRAGPEVEVRYADYPSVGTSGEVPVTLRVTDSFGSQASDTIFVTITP